MGAIAALADTVFRDYVTTGVPASGAYQPLKGDIRDLFALIETKIGAPDVNMGLGGAPDANILLTVQTGPGKRGIAINHYASELGQYALDIHQFKNAGGTDANSAIAIHNYSADYPAMVIDSTDQQALLALNNSENPVTSPGTRGSGPFISLSGYAGDYLTTRRNLGYLNGYMQFAHNYDDVMWTFATGLAINGGPALTKRTLSVKALNAGYAASISGTDSGLFLSTSSDGGNTLSIQKNGTGAGTALWIINKGVGAGLLITNAAGTTKFSVDGAGRVSVPSMPTANPGVSGMLWSDGGTIKIVA